MTRDFWWGFRFFTMGLLIVIGIIGVSAGIVIPLDVATCSQNTAVLNTQYQYHFPAGCFIKDGDQWIPYGTWVNLHNYKGK